MEPIDHLCGGCMALPGNPCTIEPEVHEARIRSAEGDAWADDWTGGALDLDGDGEPGALDYDDRYNWM